ncbi:MAG: hypothetical protein ACT4OT_16070 [Acidobacteriota bacterium]
MSYRSKSITRRWRLVLLLATVFVVAALAHAYDKPNGRQQPKPQKSGVIYYVEPADGSLQPLEACSGEFSSGKGSPAISFLACRGAKGSFRLKTNAKLEFVVRLAADSREKYFLYPVLTITKGDVRSLNIHQPARTPMRPAISTNVVKSGDLMTIKPLRPLAAGEYIFVFFIEIAGMRTVIPNFAFSFGLDAP